MACILCPLLTPNRDDMSHDPHAWKSESYFFGHPCCQRPKFMLNTFWGGGAFSFLLLACSLLNFIWGKGFFQRKIGRWQLPFLIDSNWGSVWRKHQVQGLHHQAAPSCRIRKHQCGFCFELKLGGGGSGATQLGFPVSLSALQSLLTC